MGVRGHSGMSRGVQKTFGVLGAERHAPESLSCHCGATIEFPTDEIGRVYQRCPRGCRSELLSTSVAAADAQIAQVALRQAQDVAGVARRDKATQPKQHDRYLPRTCELEGCGRTYTPKAGNQRYCSTACNLAAGNAAAVAKYRAARP